MRRLRTARPRHRRGPPSPLAECTRLAMAMSAPSSGAVEVSSGEKCCGTRLGTRSTRTRAPVEDTSRARGAAESVGGRVREAGGRAAAAAHLHLLQQKVTKREAGGELAGPGASHASDRRRQRWRHEQLEPRRQVRLGRGKERRRRAHECRRLRALLVRAARAVIPQTRAKDAAMLVAAAYPRQLPRQQARNQRLPAALRLAVHQQLEWPRLREQQPALPRAVGGAQRDEHRCRGCREHVEAERGDAAGPGCRHVGPGFRRQIGGLWHG